MKWNIENIGFLHRPDDYIGSFDIPQMQERHEKQLQEKLLKLKTLIKQESDPLRALKHLNAKDHLQFFLNNKSFFHEASRYEEALLMLYGKNNAPFSSGGDASQWNTLFSECDSDKMSQLGETITFAKATLYRGSVSGFKRSLSWTPDRKRAEQFAKRWEDPTLGGGQIFEVDVDKSNILLYRKLRFDLEVLVSPTFIQSAEIRPFTT